jgi:hypothetical protein
VAIQQGQRGQTPPTGLLTPSQDEDNVSVVTGRATNLPFRSTGNGPTRPPAITETTSQSWAGFALLDYTVLDSDDEGSEITVGPRDSQAEPDAEEDDELREWTMAEDQTVVVICSCNQKTHVEARHTTAIAYLSESDIRPNSVHFTIRLL